MTTRTLTRPGTEQPAEAGMRKDDGLTQTDPFSGRSTATRHGRPEGHSATSVADEHDAITMPATHDTDTGTQPPLTSEQIHEGFFERAAAAPTNDTDRGTQPPLTSEEIHKGFLDRQRRRRTVSYEDDVLESRGVDAARGHLAPHVPPKRRGVDVPSTGIVVAPMTTPSKADVVARQQNVTEPMGPRIQERAMWGPSRLPPPRGDAVVSKDSTVPALHRARPPRPRRNVAIVGGVVMLVACGAGALATAATCGGRGAPRGPNASGIAAAPASLDPSTGPPATTSMTTTIIVPSPGSTSEHAPARLSSAPHPHPPASAPPREALPAHPQLPATSIATARSSPLPRSSAPAPPPSPSPTTPPRTDMKWKFEE